MTTLTFRIKATLAELGARIVASVSTTLVGLATAGAVIFAGDELDGRTLLALVMGLAAAVATDAIVALRRIGADATAAANAKAAELRERADGVN